MLVNYARLFGGSGFVETGPTPLAAIAIKSELRNDQQRLRPYPRRCDSFCRFRSVEYAQIQDFLGNELRVGGTVELRYAKKHQQAWADFARDGTIHHDTRFGDALQERSHTHESIARRMLA